MSGLIVAVVVGVLLIIMGIFLLTGRGSLLLAGYNTMSKKRKAEYNAESMCKFAGKIILPIGVLTCLIGIESIIEWYAWVYTAVVVGLCVFAIVYSNTKNRFKKNKPGDM